MSSSQWLDFCQRAANVSIEQLISRFAAAYSAVGFSCVAVFILSLALSIMYFRLPTELKDSIWGHYGWFVNAICASSLMGALAWGSANGFAGYAFMHAANISAPQAQSQSRLSDLNTYPGNPSIVTSFIFQGFSFSGFIVCNFILMRRLHSLGTGSNQQMLPQNRRSILAAAVLALVLLTNIVACIIAAVYNGKIYRIYTDFNGDTSAMDAGLLSQLFSDYNRAQRFQSFSETVALTTTVLLYGFLLVICRRRLQSVETMLLSTTTVTAVKRLGSGSRSKPKLSAVITSDAGDSSRASEGDSALVSSVVELGCKQIDSLKLIRARVYTVCVICMLTMCLRAAYNMWFALTNLSLTVAPCAAACAACRTMLNLQNDWLSLMPQPRVFVIFVSEPLSYCVSLWGMTMSSDLKILLNRGATEQ